MSDAAAEVEYYLYTQFRNGIVFNLSAGILYGMYFAMYFVSVRVLLSDGPLRKSRANTFMFCITTSMFISGTVTIVLGSGLISQSIPFILQDIDPSFGAWSDRTTDIVMNIFAAIMQLNPILSDIVCAWRAVVIWRWDRRVILILTTCILGTLVAAGYDLKLAIEVHPGSQDEQGLQEGTVALVIVGPILGTNLLSTSLIAWKAWEYRKHVQVHLQPESPYQCLENFRAPHRNRALSSFMVLDTLPLDCIWGAPRLGVIHRERLHALLFVHVPDGHHDYNAFAVAPPYWE